MFIKYCKSKFKTALLYLVFIGVFCLMAFLYGLPSDALIYTVLLCIFFGFLFMIYGYWRFSQKMAGLRELQGRILYGAERMPKPASPNEEMYQDIIKTLYAQTSSVISERDVQTSEMMEYYTLWVHQIKTPIAAMRLLLQSEDSLPQRDALKIELFKIEQYVEMVLQYLRLDSDTTDFLLKKQPLDPIIKGAVRKYSTMFIKKKVTLEYEPVDCTVASDEKWLSFVIEQVLSNAIKYTPKGKILIYMDKEKKDTLVIEDTGIGIQPEDIPRVFDRGYTGYNGRTDKKSTGIGLYLCKQVMKKLGHSISIESELGVGTKVKLGLGYTDVTHY